MRMKSGTPKPSADRIVRDIRRKTRKRHSKRHRLIFRNGVVVVRWRANHDNGSLRPGVSWRRHIRCAPEPT